MRKVAHLKMLFSVDLGDVDKDIPEDPEDFCILVQALIGTDPDDAAADTFSLLVCTASRVPGHIPAGQALSGRSYLFLRRWDIHLVRRTIEGWCQAAAAESWEQVAERLCRYMDWEYES